MKKVLSLALLVAVGAFVVFMTGCDIEPPDGVVTGLKAEAVNDGLGIKVSWNAFTDADDYTIYFNGTLLEEQVTVTYYEHITGCEPGSYVVTAFVGNDETDNSDALSTEPISVESKQVWELNGSGSSGIGFDVDAEAVATYSMASDANKSAIDCYFTNWLVKSDGFGGPYDLCSPASTEGEDPLQGDAGKPFADDVVGWRVTGITENALTGNIGDITELPATGYYSYSENVAGDATYGIYTEDGYYGMIQIVSISTDNGQVDIKVTFQPIMGFRLF